jgi:hypothetical protein
MNVKRALDNIISVNNVCNQRIGKNTWSSHQPWFIVQTCCDIIKVKKEGNTDGI